MSELFLKETTKDDATFVAKVTETQCTRSIHSIEEITYPKVVDLSGLVGDTKILFEFSKVLGIWEEGYLLHGMTCGQKPKFTMSKKHYCTQNGMYFTAHYSYERIRLQDDRWYFHDGKSGCVLPEGVDYEVKVISSESANTQIFTRDRNFFTSEGIGNIWKHRAPYFRVIAYRPTGLLPGYVMPGGE